MTARDGYKVERGEFGGEECYRFSAGYGAVLVTFDEAREYGGLFGLDRNGNQKATVTQVRLPVEIRRELEQIAAGDD